MLQCFGELSRARLLGFEQARVLDGDDRLCGEALYELNKAATGTIPIVFSTIGDPVQIGLVASLRRPRGQYHRGDLSKRGGCAEAVGAAA
jgi:hypothetical protein